MSALEILCQVDTVPHPRILLGDHSSCGRLLLGRHVFCPPLLLGLLVYPSRDIFVRRLNRLVSSHAAIWCPRREGEQVVAGAQAKLYLTDPLLATLPSRLRTGLPGPT